MGNLISGLSSSRLFLIALLAVAAFVVSRIVRRVMNKLAERYTSKRIIIKTFIPLITIALHVSAALYIVFGILRITADTLLALGLSAGVAVGFAIQDVLANVFGGLVIIFTRPFNIGDKIDIGSFHGEVMDINLLKVKLLTNDDSMITVPPKIFLQSPTSNANAGTLDCQVVTEAVVPGDLDTAVLREIAREAVISSPFAYLEKPVTIIVMDQFSGFCTIKLRMKAYVYDHRYENMFASDVTERLKGELSRRGLVPQDFYRGPAWLAGGG